MDILFTKPGCEKCEWVKKRADLSKVQVLSLEQELEAAEAWMELAWYGLVRLAETQLPILVKDGRVIVGAITIKRVLDCVQNIEHRS